MNKQEIEKAIEILEADIKRYIKKDISENTESIGLQAVLKYRKAKISAWKLAISALQQQLTNGWIPVSEQLPPQPKDNTVFENKPLDLYLVSVKNENYPFRVFWNGKSFTDGWNKVDAIAWQPLPQPYTE